MTNPGKERQAGIRSDKLPAGAGFTLIEVLIVIFIVGMLVAIGVFTYLTSLDDIKLRSDVRELNQTLQMAKMRAIATGVHHGVAFSKSDNAYFVFSDCPTTHPSEYYDADGNYKNNQIIDDWDVCLDLDYDPRVPAQAIKQLSAGNTFGTITGGSTSSSTLEYILFNGLGQAMQGHNFATGDIFIERINVKEGTHSRAGVHVTGASGITETIPIRRL